MANTKDMKFCDRCTGMIYLQDLHPIDKDTTTQGSLRVKCNHCGLWQPF